jgi:Beta-propeller repeat
MAAAANSNSASAMNAHFKMNRHAKKFLFAALAFGLTVLAVTAQTTTSIGNLPLYFEAAHGQDNGPAQFITRGRDAEFLISAAEARFVLQKSGATRAVQMQFIGANPHAQISGDSELSGKINYLTGNDPARWRSGISTFAQVRVEQIYPGVNLIYYGNQQQLEYDFTVAPNTNPNAIAIHFDGAGKISVNAQGELVLNLGRDEIRQPKPLIYQTAGGARRKIDGGYKILDAHTVAFAVGNYDRSLPLVIDPILSYSTYFGGNFGETAWAVAVSTNDNSVYIAGETFSTRFSQITTNAYQTNFMGGTLTGDAFVAKFGSSGTNLIYMTYLGGNDDDGALGLALDGAGDAYVTGFTDSSNFPVTNSIAGGVPGITNSTNISGTFNKSFGYYPVDGFVAELNTNGSRLIYSTYLGGSGSDSGNAIAVDAAGNAYVTGFTASTNFPTANALAFRLIGRTNTVLNYLACTNNAYSDYFNENAFVAEIAARGTNFLFSSYLGGNNYDEGKGIAVDGAGDVYVTGYTASTNFPTTNFITQTFINSFGTNSYQGNLLNSSTNVWNGSYDVFVTKLAPAGNGFTLVYSTYLGGTNDDHAYGIAFDNSGAAYVTGSTDSTNFPQTLTNVIRSGLTNNTAAGFTITTNAFLTKLTNDLVTGKVGIDYSLTFGGVRTDVANGIAIDPATNVFIVGTTSSTNFPCFPTSNTGFLRVTNSGYNDVFVTAFSAANPTTCSLLYSAYLGGKYSDYGDGIAVDSAGSAYVVGQTLSTNFPTFNAYQTTLDGTNDAFLAKILLTLASPTLTAVQSGTNVLVFWPPIGQDSSVFKLQSNTNLLSTNWVTVPQSPVLTNGSNIFIFNPTNPAKFFRLRAY